MDLIEHSSEQRMGREAAAERLRSLADELARQNEVSFVRDGRRFTVRVPDEVVLKLEIEIGEDGSEIEIELQW
ncbi:MAG TPA: amphi-Trp domain-containing protein [Nitriliruptorales bacterium]|nr:amphi-Trp domain-containing protein [Nitriliruptorales bacterium]